MQIKHNQGVKHMSKALNERTEHDVLKDIQELNEELKAASHIKGVPHVKERLAVLKMELDTMRFIKNKEDNANMGFGVFGM